MPQWQLTGSGEWVWPLRPQAQWPDNQTYHLLVWRVGKQWNGAIVLDGDYQAHIVPMDSVEEAKRILLTMARNHLFDQGYDL